VRVTHFDPHRLTPSASLNRVMLVDLPGLAVDAGVRGKTGFQLASADALTGLIRWRASELGLDPDCDGHELRLAFDGCLGSPEARVRTTAQAIGRCIGRNLGYLLLTLKRGDAVNRAARAEWDESYWRHWGRVERVWLGGGLVGGRLGPLVQEHARAVFEEAGIPEYSIQVSPYAPVLALVGAARHAPPNCELALSVDLGHTRVKRAISVYREGALTEMRLLPSLPTGWTEIEPSPDDSIQYQWAAQLLNEMVTRIADVGRGVGGSRPIPTLLSLSAYVRAGHPMPAQDGAYVQLRRVTDNLQQELTRRISVRLGRAVNILLIHDGTAAAAVYAEASNAAVVSLGTALGVGFSTGAGENSLRPMRTGFTVAILAPDGAER